MESLCRLCAKQSLHLESVFSFADGRLVSDLISIVCPIRIDVADLLPKKICVECKDIVVCSNKLRETCVMSDILFRTGNFDNEEPTETAIQCVIPPQTVLIKEEFSDYQVLNDHQIKEEQTNVQLITFATEFVQLVEPTRKRRDKPSHASTYKRPRNSSATEFRCIQCDKYFHNMGNYRRHMRDIHKFTQYCPLKCSLCGESFWSKKMLEQHQQKNHSGLELPSFNCDLCPAKEDDKISLEYHMFMDHTMKKVKQYERIEGEPYTCPICFRSFNQWSNCNRHAKDIHKMKIFSTEMHSQAFNYEVLQRLRCDKCFASFGKKSHMEKHLDWHLTYKPVNRNFHCGICEEELHDEMSFLRHCNENHGDEVQAMNSNSQRFHRCESCHEDFGSKISLNKHIKADHKYRLYDCHHFPCRQRFPSKILLHKHVKKHKKLVADPKTGRFICLVPFCRKMFNDKNAMRRHILAKHFSSQEKAERLTAAVGLMCFQCGKQFTTKKRLTDHALTHEHDE